jgi:hypothetical protein
MHSLVPLPFTLLFPRDHLAAKPQLAATLAEVDDGPGHRRVSTLVTRDGVALSEPEQLSYSLRVNDVFSIDEPSHRGEPTTVGTSPPGYNLKRSSKYY